MRTLYVEGVATHDDPESCAGVRKGAGEALTGVRAGPVLSREIKEFGVPTLSKQAEGHIAGDAIASPRRTLRGQRPGACTESPCARTGRSHARLVG
jgi:RNA-directed DNA polymerase